jgi:hypothetical protein
MFDQRTQLDGKGELVSSEGITHVDVILVLQRI